MSQRRSRTNPGGPGDPAALATVATQAGGLTVALSLLLTVGALTGLLAGGGSLAVVPAAMATPLGIPGGLAWLFHLGVVGILGGT